MNDSKFKVYFAQQFPYVVNIEKKEVGENTWKVGFTTSPKARIQTLRTNNSKEYFYRYFIFCKNAEEMRLIEKLVKIHLRKFNTRGKNSKTGEFYNVDSKYIKELVLKIKLEGFDFLKG